ncbi:hypothetical protein [Brevibacterium sp. UCMA 11754]|uniref:hypothetical protein n=1 Tax=Brevibacterium sp. UCMA 11754 TaxID=2749198 RepID=UPI001F453161|nr:hypothetical protein [Brevibacterium sp. UCMA 11754]MCF2573511.1 hypothetical protein [Brevibacterium sp. UCMA 11754]
MTSPDFMYPQPTDDELAAQQPYTAALGLGSHAHDAGHSPASPDSSASLRSPRALGTELAHDEVTPTGANRPRLGKIALVLTIIAAGLSLIASIILGVTIGPMENDSGYFFADTPSWYQNLAIAFSGLQVLCAALGVTGLIMGIVSAVTGTARTQGIVAIAIAVLAPFISFGIFMVLAFTFA